MLYRFDQFELDRDKLCITSDGLPVCSDERIVSLMLLLIEAAPEHVSQDELLSHLWPDTVVSNWSVSRLISDARKVFKRIGIQHPVIQTLHGRGYRLSSEALGQMQQESTRAPAQAQEPSAIEPNTRPEASPATQITRGLHWKRNPVILLVLLLLSFLVAGTLGWLYLAPKEQPLRLSEPSEITGRILWVDDHPQNNQKEQAFLQQQRIAVYNTSSSHDALMLLAMYHYDVVISDMGRNGDPLAGFKLVETMRQRGDQTPFVMYTIVPSDAQRMLLAEHGGQGVAVDTETLYQLLGKFVPLKDD